MSSSHNNGMTGGTCVHLSGLSSSSVSNAEGDRPSPEEGSPPEVLGSVVHCHESENGDKNCCIQLRTSARVSKKLRLDSLASQVVPEKKEVPVAKEEEKPEKPEAKPKRRPWELWPLEDKNTFFEALNEFGKDFDAIQKHFEAKAKRKNVPEGMVKNKEQIRHFYYRTWHKISKHLKFPDEVKKGTQELYGLINFGELRKKIGGVSEKTSLKLNELIYRGYTKIRIRGKTIRIKTPICRALRKLNQQEELAEELKLPTHVAIELRPRTNEAWARVQAVAQNPRLRTLLPLQRRLSTLISFLEQKWQPRAVRHCVRLKQQLDAVCADILNLEEAVDSEALVNNDNLNGNEVFPTPSTSYAPTPSPAMALRPEGRAKGKGSTERTIKEPIISSNPRAVLRVAPSSHVAVTPLTVNLSDYFTSTRLSLNSHEERLGNHGAEELFNAMVLASTKGCNKRGAKRQRLDSFSDKKLPQPQQTSNQPHANGEAVHSTANLNDSPEIKDGMKSNHDDGFVDSPFRLFGSEVNMNMFNGPPSTGNGDAISPTSTAVHNEPNGNGTSAVLSAVAGDVENPEKKPGPGPSVRSNGLIRMADDEEKVKSTEELVNKIRGGWTGFSANALTVGELYLMFGSDSKIMLEYWWEEEPTAEITAVSGDAESAPDTSKPENKLALTLQKLLSIVKLHEKQKPPRCPCGHVCNGVPKPPPASKPKAPRPIRFKPDLEKSTRMDCSSDGVLISSAINSATAVSSSILHDGPFRRPLIPSLQVRQLPMTGPVETFTAQLEKFRPRYCNRRGRPSTSRKNVVVPRMLPLLPKAPSNSPLLAVQILPQTGGDFLPPKLINIDMATSGKVPIQRVARKIEPAPSATAANPAGLQRSTVAKCTELPAPPQPPSEKQQESVPLQETETFRNTEVVDVGNASAHVQDVFPSVINDMIETPVSSPPSISNLLDMSLSSELGLSSANGLLDSTNFSGFLNPDTVPTSTPTSPSRILKEEENQWLTAEVGDFSLSSLLGHLESPVKRDNSLIEAAPSQDSRELNAMTADVEGQMQCLMAENSLDYIGKFADLAAQIASDGMNKN